MENIYALAYGPEDAPTFFYVGKTSQTVEQRFAQHVRGFNDPLDHKPAYEFWRHLPEDVEVRAILLDTTDSGLTEQDYVRALILEGHPLTNANLGNSKVAKKRTKSTFAELNRQADERLEAIERRKRLHSDAQTLSKPEIVHQRVLGMKFTASDLDSLQWIEAPFELIPMRRLPKNFDGIRCESCKVGDYIFYVAFKGNKYLTHVKNTRTNQTIGTHASWCEGKKHMTRLEALTRLMAYWDKAIWYTASERP